MDYLSTSITNGIRSFFPTRTRTKIFIGDLCGKSTNVVGYFNKILTGELRTPDITYDVPNLQDVSLLMTQAIGFHESPKGHIHVPSLHEVGGRISIVPKHLEPRSNEPITVDQVLQAMVELGQLTNDQLQEVRALITRKGLRAVVATNEKAASLKESEDVVVPPAIRRQIEVDIVGARTDLDEANISENPIAKLHSAEERLLDAAHLTHGLQERLGQQKKSEGNEGLEEEEEQRA